MTDGQLQRSLDRLARLAERLDVEAKRRYGEDGMLFFEAEGSFHIMDGDACGNFDSAVDRQKHVRFSSVHTNLSAGAW